MPLYTPFFEDVSKTITSGQQQRNINQLAGSAYMGDQAAMEQLMRVAPDIGIKIQEKKKSEQQQTLQQESEDQKQKRQIYIQNKTLMDGIFKNAANFDNYDEAKKYIQDQFNQNQDILGEHTDASNFTPEAFNQIKKIYGKETVDQATIDSYVQNILNGNATLRNVPIKDRDRVSLSLNKQGMSSYSPEAINKLTRSAQIIKEPYLKLPQYQLTSQALPYLARIDAALTVPGSISDQDLLDSLTKINTGGAAVTEAQINTILKGRSWPDALSRWQNKLSTGGVLSDEQRKEIDKIAKAIYQNYLKQWQPLYHKIRGQLKATGIPEQFWSLPNLEQLSAEAGYPLQQPELNVPNMTDAEYEAKKKALGL